MECKDGHWIDVFVSSQDAPGCSEHLAHPFIMDDNDRWRTIKVDLDHGVKEVREIKLVGYSSLIALWQDIAELENAEVWENDFLILRIKEIPGQVVSNNSFANGAFAVLHVAQTSGFKPGNSHNNIRHEFHPDGIATQTLDASHSTLRNLTLEVVNSTGHDMRINRLNLWFKLLVTRG